MTDSLIGKPLPRIDSSLVLSGEASYTDDLEPVNTAYVRMLRSPHPHAKIKKIDTSKAEALPGVYATLTYKDVPRMKYNPSNEALIRFQTYSEDLYVLDNEVRYVGDEVAAVAAENEDIAEEAMKLIEVEYEILPAVFDPLEAMKPEAPRVHSDIERNLAAEVRVEYGNLEEAFKKSDCVLERTYKAPYQSHCYMEPDATIAYFDKGGNLKIWASTQIPNMVPILLNKLFSMPINKIQVIKPYVGGGYGGKADVLRDIPICALLSKKAGKPVKYVRTRHEVFTASLRRHAAIIRLKMGAKKDGTITAIDFDAIIDTGAYASHGPTVINALGSYMIVPLKLDNVRFHGYCVYTNTNIAGAFRGYGNPQATFARESIIDEIADELGIDPITIRLKNVIKTGDQPLGYMYPVGTCLTKECIEKVAEKTRSWKNEEKTVCENKARGVGISCYAHSSGIKPVGLEHSSVFLKVNIDGTVDLLTGVAEIGQGITTALAQLVANELGIDISDVRVVTGDTACTPFDPSATASRTLYVAGNTVVEAARDAKKQLFELASKILKAKPEQLEVGKRKIYVKDDPKKEIPIAKATEIGFKVAEGSRVILTKMHCEPPNIHSTPIGAVAVEVEVDRETGEVRIQRIYSAYDIGRPINLLNVEGQILGGLVMALGYTFTENHCWDKSTGRMLNPNFFSYSLLRAGDVPKIDYDIIESTEKVSHGGKGVGEHTMVGLSSAITNAIYDAVKVRVRDLPVTPEKVCA